MTPGRAFASRLDRRFPLSAAIFILAVLTRLAFFRDVKDLPTYRIPQSDEMAAHQAAVACVEGKLPHHAYLKAPLYTYFLAGIYKVFGPDPDYARTVQAVICSLSPVLVFLIAERLFGGWVALVSGLVGAVYWVFVFYAVELVDASLASLFYLLLAWLLVRRDEGRWWHWATVGAVLGIGAITRPNVLICAPVLAMAAWIVTLVRARRSSVGGVGFVSPIADALGHTTPKARNPKPETGFAPWRAAMVNVLALTAGCCTTIAPVTIRNRLVGGEWVPIAAYAGINFWVANNPESDGKNIMFLVGKGVPEASPIDPNDVWSDADLNNRIARAWAERALGRPVRRGELDNFCLKMGFHYVREYPRKFLGDVVKRFVWFFNAYEFATVRDPYLVCRFSRVLRALSYFHFGVLCPLWVIGLILATGVRDGRPGRTYWLLIIASMLLGGLAFVMNSRFRVPLVCLGVPAAGYAVVRLIDLCRSGRSWSRRVRFGVGLIGVALLSNWDVLGYRPPYHTDLRFAETMACWQAGRVDLLPEAAARLEEALQADEATGRRTWSTVIVHARPYSVLCGSYILLRDAGKALHYGKLMMLKEPLKPEAGRSFFGFLTQLGPSYALSFYDELIRADRREAAGLLLEMLAPSLPDADALNLTSRFANRYNDPAGLQQAQRILTDLIRRQSDSPVGRQMVDQIRETMRTLGLETQPAGRTTSASVPEVPPHAP